MLCVYHTYGCMVNTKQNLSFLESVAKLEAHEH